MKTLEQHLKEKGLMQSLAAEIVVDIIKAAHEFYNEPRPIKPELPMWWEDLGQTIKGYVVGIDSNVHAYNGLTANIDNRNVFPTREEAEASIALAQLLQLRNAWGGRRYDTRNNVINVQENMGGTWLIAFDDLVTRDLFQTIFADLIEKAAPLL